MSRYIIVTGGVMSGLGKGITVGSIGKTLQARGYSVTAIKIDPYLNVDAGTLRPTEHGEVWVTEDGGETDQDLGHYERFLDINLGRTHNITTGQIYSAVVEKERRGDYLGRTVEAIPHMTDEIKRRIRTIADTTKTDFVLVEIGGVIGEYQNELYYRAARMMKDEDEQVLFAHVSYLPVPSHVGEMKTKPTQQSVEALGRLDIQPDFIVCRSEYPVDDIRKEKLRVFCHVKKEDVISNPDLTHTYELPLIFEEQGFASRILQKFGLPIRTPNLTDWTTFVDNLKNGTKSAKVGIVGKYFDVGDFRLGDSYISVIEAIKHACANNKVNPEIKWVDSKDFEENKSNLKTLDAVNGIIVPGGFGASGTEGIVLAIQYAREKDIPFLGLCLGLQLAVVEFARNVCGLEGAHSTEINQDTKYPVIDFLPEQKDILFESRYGATMRLGGQSVRIKEGTLAHKLYGMTEAMERFRHRYEINSEYVDILEKNGFVFSGFTPDGTIKQIGELPKHKFFIGTQAHPEFTSRPLRPNPLFDGFIKALFNT